jgi:hypothetical protein
VVAKSVWKAVAEKVKVRIDTRVEMSDNNKSVGSGYFSAFAGLMSIIFGALAYLTPHIVIDPKLVLVAWLLLSGTFMSVWGVNRVINGDKRLTYIGQPTLNFVTAVLAVTFAIWAVIASKP